MNKVILMGRLTREPVVRYPQTPDGSAVARYTLAVDRRRRQNAREGEQTADFISCVAFGKTAEFVANYLHQGTKIVVTGRIATGSYVNQQGQTVYTTDVIVEEHEFAESRNAQGGNVNNQGGYNNQAPAPQSRPQNNGSYNNQRPQSGGYANQNTRPAPAPQNNHYGTAAQNFDEYMTPPDDFGFMEGGDVPFN